MRPPGARTLVGSLMSRASVSERLPGPVPVQVVPPSTVVRTPMTQLGSPPTTNARLASVGWILVTTG